MARTVRFSQVLWLLTTAWLAACGRLGFGEHNDAGTGALSDAPLATQGPDAPIPADAPIGPIFGVMAIPAQSATCGTAPAAQVVTILNKGDQDLVISAVAPTAVAPVGPQYVFTTDFAGPMTIKPGDTGTIMIQAPTSTIGTDLAGTTIKNTLQFTTNEATPPAPVDVSVAVTGANLVVNPGNLAFTNAVGNCPVDKMLTIQNTGTTTADVLVTPFSSSGNGLQLFSGFSGGAITAGSTMTVTFHALTSNSCMHTEGQVTITAMSGTTICNPSTGVDITVNANLNIMSGSNCTCTVE